MTVTGPARGRLPSMEVTSVGEVIKISSDLAEVFAVTEAEPEIDLDAVLGRQSDLLARWKILGEELRRRTYDLPADIRFEIAELIRETDV
jgi:hypothetical protein